LKQLIAQAAIEVQSPVPLSFACPGQSSIGWEADISIAGAGGTLKAAPAAAGSSATATAIKTANMVRPTAIRICEFFLIMGAPPTPQWHSADITAAFSNVAFEGKAEDRKCSGNVQ
jgi:hypothetical protein